jgi:hypothetical protein
MFGHTARPGRARCAFEAVFAQHPRREIVSHIPRFEGAEPHFFNKLRIGRLKCAAPPLTVEEPHHLVHIQNGTSSGELADPANLTKDHKTSHF